MHFLPPSPRFGAFRLSTLSVLPLVAACASGQIGGEIDNSEEAHSGVCDETATSLLDDEAGPLAFAPEDLKSLVEGTYRRSLSWNEVGGSTLEVTPGAGATMVDMTITPIDGTSRLVEREEARNSGEELAAPARGQQCSDGLSLEAEVAVRTDDGALDETLRMTFFSDDGKTARSSTEIDPDATTGSFALELSGDENAKLLPTRLELQIALGQVTGTLRGGLEVNHGDAVSAQAFEFATFPADNPCEMGLLVEDSPWASEIDELLTNHETFDFSWQGQDAVELTIEADEMVHLCFESGADGGEILRGQTSFAVRLADGSISGSWPLSVLAHVADDALVSVEVQRDAYMVDSFSNETFPTEAGFSGVESDAEELTFSFGYTVHSSDDLPASGELTLIELEIPDCARADFVPPVEHDADGEQSSPACEGITPREFRRATFIER